MYIDVYSQICFEIKWPLEAVIELYKRISRGWKKKSLLSVQPLKRVSTEFQAQGICRTSCGTSS